MKLHKKREPKWTVVEKLLSGLGNGVAVLYNRGHFEVCQFDPKGRRRILAANIKMGLAIRTASLHQGGQAMGSWTGVSGQAVITGVPRRGTFMVGLRKSGGYVVPVRIIGCSGIDGWLPLQNMLTAQAPDLLKLLRVTTRFRFEGWFVTGQHHEGHLVAQKLKIGRITFNSLEA